MSKSLSEHVHDAKSSLLEAKRTLVQEISNYPAPISGCDAQFNHLLAERRRVDTALEALDAEIHVPTPRAP